MWKERLKPVALWLSFMILLLLDIWIYTVLYFWSRSYRMSFYVIGNWIMSEKVCLGIYILAALLCNIALYLRPFGKLCIKIISVLFGPVLLLLTITCFACGDIMIDPLLLIRRRKRNWLCGKARIYQQKLTAYIVNNITVYAVNIM